jgi:hypothetical protein
MAARFGQVEMEAHLRWAEGTLADLERIAGQQRNAASTRKEKNHAGR